MIKKLKCPFTSDYCIRDSCQLWVVDVIKITNEKTGKSGVKDFSDCSFHKIAEPKDIIEGLLR